MKIGAFEVLGELGRGGMGVVYRVRLPEGREAALKVLKKADPGALARFERERRLLASLGEKDGFVGLLDAGVSAEGAWLLMPFVPGGTLRERLAAGPLGVEETVALGVRLAEALGAAHERGVVHRDVKPENVLFTAEGRPLLADLGLAKHFDRLAQGASQSVALSRSGAFKGTAGYVAPEQLVDAAGAGPRCDVFSLGAVLYECLAGRPAFQGETVVDVLTRVSSGSAEPIGRPGVPARLEEAVMRALAREPGARFADGGALARAIDPERSKGAAGRTPRRGIATPLALGAALGGVVLAALALGGTRRGRAAHELVVRAGVKLGAGDRDGAIEDARHALELDPTLAAAWRVRGAARLEKGDQGGAIADATKAIELDPGLALAWSDRGAARSTEGDWDGEIADCTRAVELDPGLALAWSNRGAARGNKGDWDGEIADCTRAIETDPRLALAWSNRGAARSKKGDWDGLLDDSTRAIELDPRFAIAWANRGHARGEKGDWDGDIDDSTRALELDPKVASAWCNRGQARGQKGDCDGNIDDSTRAIELDPKIAFAWANRAAARGQKGDWDGQTDDSTRAIELDPKLAFAWANRAYARGQKGDWDGQIGDSTRAIELDPKLAPPWGIRGQARSQKGDLEGAVSDLKRFLELAPGDPQAPAVRGVLDQLEANRTR